MKNLKKQNKNIVYNAMKTNTTKKTMIFIKRKIIYKANSMPKKMKKIKNYSI